MQPAEKVTGPYRTTSAKLARRALLTFTLGFIAARAMVFLIMSRRVPNMYFFLGGTHVHHLNYGILLLAAVAGYVLFRQPGGRELEHAALIYGFAMALTFDEFGMWLHLGGSYWQRASVDAVIIVAALFGLVAFAPSLEAFEARHFRASVVLVVALIAFGFVLWDTHNRIGDLVGPSLRELEQSSSP